MEDYSINISVKKKSNIPKVSASSSLQFLRGRILNMFFKNLPFMWPRQTIKLSNLDKSRMKHEGLLNKHFFKKKLNIPKGLAEIVNFQFSHYKSMEILGCHSNQSSYPTGIKNKTFVENNVLCNQFTMPSFSFILLTVPERKNFEYFFKNLPFMWPRQTIKLSNLDKSGMKHGGLINKHFCKK